MRCAVRAAGGLNPVGRWIAASDSVGHQPQHQRVKATIVITAATMYEDRATGPVVCAGFTGRIFVTP